MKLTFISLISLVLLSVGVHAQDKTKGVGEAEMKWPGIKCQIIIIKRVPPNRLLVVVRLAATSEASPGGTLIGYTVSVPPMGNKKGPSLPLTAPSPFSLASSVMTDEKTKITYATLPPVAPPGKAYRPGATLGFLKPNQNLVLTIQFAVPPPLPPDPSTGIPPKQTVSFMLPNAKGPIARVLLPPPAEAAASAN